jgi:lipoprotein-releasing system permease protein
MLEIDLAMRFLRRRRSSLLRGTALAALASIALASAALVVTLALMNGYSGAIAEALQRGNAHLVGFSGAPMTLEEARDVAGRVAEVDGVRRATPVTYLAGLLRDPAEPANPLPVVLKAVATPPSYTGLDAWPRSDGVPAVLGARLAQLLGLVPGDRTVVTLPPHAGSWLLPTLTLQVSGTFRLEFAEFDQRWIVVPLEAVMTGLPEAGVAGIEVELVDPLAVGAVRAELEEVAPRLMFTDWREMNSHLFAALRWQTLSLFLVLSLVVAVASFQVSSALVVLAIDKRRTAGMLQALGARPATVRRVLVLAGLILGEIGVACGVALGAAVSAVFTALRVVRFPDGLARVYMVDHIPFVIDLGHLVAVIAVCTVLVAAASWWPAWRTSRLDPVAALRAV